MKNTVMDPKRKKKLEERGWRFGTVAEFLGLSDEEMAYIDMKISLAKQVRKRRRRKKMTQVELAKLISSSQSRVAKMEAGDPSVSLDLLVKTLMALGATNKDVGRSIAELDTKAT
jgi:DNA-binding XRE family transcriptional regulator